MRLQSSTIVICAALSLSLGLGSKVAGAADGAKGRLPNPRLLRLRPCGAEAGTTVEVRVGGDDLDGAAALLFSHPGISGRLANADTPDWRRSADGPFTVTVAPDVPPGTYEARVLGRLGLSTSWPFEVSELPVVVEKDGNDTREAAMDIEPDTLIDGDLAKNLPNFYRFKATAGQRFALAFSSRLLTPKGNLLVQVWGPGGKLITSGCGTRQRDPVLPFVATATGDHVVQVIDSELDRFMAEGPYRMVLATRPLLVGVWPPMLSPATTGSCRLIGHLLPSGMPLLPAASGQCLEEVAGTITAPSAPDPGGPGRPFSARVSGFGIDAFTHRMRLPAGPSNAVSVAFAVAPPGTEAEPNDGPEAAQRISLPCDVAGRFDARADLDWYTFTAAKGETYAIEVISERMGQEADVSLLVEHVSRGADGNERVTVAFEQDEPTYRFFNPPFDTVSSDPLGMFTAAEDGTHRILVQNLAARSYVDSAAMYRLVLRRPKPDFRLLATVKDVFPHTGERNEWSLSFPAIPRLRGGGRFPVTVQLYREDGFDEAVELSVTGLPPEVSCRGATIPPGLSQATIILEATADAPAWQGPIRVVGTAAAGAGATRRVAGWATSIANKPSPQEITLGRLVDEMPLDVRPEPAPLSVAPSGDTAISVASGTKVRLPVTVAAATAVQGQVRVEVRGLPVTRPAETVKPPFTLLAEAATEGMIEFDLPEGLAPGEYAVFLAAQAVMPRVRDAVAAAGALAARQAGAGGGCDAEAEAVLAQADALIKANEPRPTEVFAVSSPVRLRVVAREPAADEAPSVP